METHTPIALQEQPAQPWRMPEWMRPFAPLFLDMELRPATVETIEAAVNLRGTFAAGDPRMAERQRIVWQLRFLVRLAEWTRQQKAAKPPSSERTP
jgi:hypothetical protein